VVGGRLSEGINFNDELCRLMVVVGLPYPNSQSQEMKEKIAYWDWKGISGFNGSSYYSNLCLKLVNQSIGRAVRHINDYSALVLLD
jgi:chromosome transmission fidelity protein 1